MGHEHSNNRMADVAGLLGLELFEKFDVEPRIPFVHPLLAESVMHNPFYFTDEGLLDRFGCLDDRTLVALLTGQLRHTVLPGEQQFHHQD